MLSPDETRQWKIREGKGGTGNGWLTLEGDDLVVVDGDGGVASLPQHGTAADSQTVLLAGDDELAVAGELLEVGNLDLLV